MAAIAAVLLGGIVGSGLRLLIELAVPHTGREFPLATLLVNVLGSLILGILVARLWPVAPDWLKAGLGAGLLGSFTTFSALSVSLVALGAEGQWFVAVGYLLLSVVLGFAGAWLGLSLGKPAVSR